MELMERRRILLNTPHINIVTGLQFVTDMVAPLESLVINFSPIQDLHGYDSPWPAGGGKNLLNASADTGSLNNVTYTNNGDGTYTVNGTASGTSTLVVGSIELTANTQYVVSGCPGAGSGSSYNVRIRDANYTALGFDVGNGVTITPTETKTYYYQITVVSGYSVSNLIFKPMICLSTASNPDYAHFAPYSNICPISGWTGANVVACGVNVWDEEWEVGGINNTTGEPEPSNQFIRSKNFIRVAPSTQYYMTFSGGYRYAYDENKNYIGTINLANPTPSNCHYIKFRLTTQYGTTYNNDVSINCPSTDHDYHPYVGTSVNIDWTNEAGTVYGGTLNVITGELIVDRVGFDGGDINWVKVDDYNYGNFYSPNLNPLPKYSATVPTVLSSIYRSAATSSGTSGDAYAWIRSVNTGMRRIYIKDTSKANMTAEEIKTSLIGVDFVYVLDEPIIYQLTPQQIRTVKGTNNLFSNSNGEVTVNYWTHLD